MATKLFTKLTEENPFQKIYSWQSPERYWVPKDRSWYLTYSLFFVVLIAFLALINEFLYILVVLSFVFLWFVQGAKAPATVEHTVTSLGIRTFETFYKWRNIKHFWFSKKNDTILLNLETFEDEKPDIIKRISLLVNENEDDNIFRILIQYLDYGDQKEIGYNFLVHIIQGEHFDSQRYMEDTDKKPEE